MAGGGLGGCRVRERFEGGRVGGVAHFRWRCCCIVRGQRRREQEHGVSREKKEEEGRRWLIGIGMVRG